MDRKVKVVQFGTGKWQFILCVMFLKKEQK